MPKSTHGHWNPRKHDRTVHDLGFIFLSTYGRWYRLTREPALRDVLVEAGRTLSLRRQKGGYLASFIGPSSLFIDIMMNVGLILWAAKATGDAELKDIALAHCRTTARYLVRPDGSTAHEGLFDPKTGNFLEQSTHQGWNAESTWTRGLAWALYGFASVFRLSGLDEFLAVSQRCADCYLRRVQQAGENGVPYWDFDLPADVPHLFDSSAAAITASGLFELAEIADSENNRQRYRQAAHSILQALCTDRFLPRNKPEWEGILLEGIYHFHKNLGVSESVAWGDHFFVEALFKALYGCEPLD
ncbi:MAG: hypothetical protein KatS3mg105_1814 [Gemmatales bacterium]|nr:MAG: hypothetical protein KatS3mg105_1814 [Gemmatales bacterium]